MLVRRSDADACEFDGKIYVFGVYKFYIFFLKNLILMPLDIFILKSKVALTDFLVYEAQKYTMLPKTNGLFCQICKVSGQA